MHNEIEDILGKLLTPDIAKYVIMPMYNPVDDETYDSFEAVLNELHFKFIRQFIHNDDCHSIKLLRRLYFKKVCSKCHLAVWNVYIPFNGGGRPFCKTCLY